MDLGHAWGEWEVRTLTFGIASGKKDAAVVNV
jgi:hypothetical protein